MSDQKKNPSRRDFLDSAISGLSLFIVGLFSFLTGNFYKSLRVRNETIFIPLITLRPGLNSFDQLFVIREQEQIRVLHRKCPHLGCTVEYNISEDQIRCPCHGSVFDMKGRYIRGPAKRDLHVPDYSLTEDQQIRVRL